MESAQDVGAKKGDPKVKRPPFLNSKISLNFREPHAQNTKVFQFLNDIFSRFFSTQL